MHVLATTSLLGFAPDAFVRINQRTAVQPISSSVKADAGAGLERYMRLPVEQYTAIELPLRAELTRLPRGTADQYFLRVPPLTFALPGSPLTVQPSVVATVQSEAQCVRISSDSCTLSGSPLIEALKLNERFEFRVRTLLTWEVPPAAATTSTSATAATTSGLRRRRPTPVPPRMRADTTIEVDVATPPLFAWIPRPVLEGIATGATTLVLDSLQRSFLRNLAKDYERWATDRGYREERAKWVMR